MKFKTRNQAFTLLEMLLVIAIIAILAGIVIVAINPGRQLAQARNAQRSSDLRAIHSAVQQYYIDNKSWPTTTLSGTLQEICDEDGEPLGCLDLTDALVPTYISAIPRDPQASVGTNYRIAINQNTNTPELTAPSSTEYSLEPVQLGTTTLASGVDTCDAECEIVIALREGLVGYWPLDETSGTTAYDESVSGYNGTIVGATINQTGKVGQAISFDGNDTITTSWTGISGANSRTASAWFKASDLNTYRTLVSWGDLTSPGRLFEFGLSSVGTVWGHPSGNPIVNSSSTYDDNLWHHAVWVHSLDGPSSLYVDGVSVSTMTRILNTYTTKFVGIGYRTTDNTDYFNGLIDEVAIWSRALSTDEISALYNSGSGRSLVQE